MNRPLRITLPLLVLVGACTAKGVDSADSTPSASNNCVGTDYEGTDICTSWRMGTAAPAYIVTDGSGDQVDVQSVEVSGDTIVVTTDGIPSYETEITQALLDELNSRPLASTDFANGSPTVSVGDVVSFGQDMGWNSTGCTRDGVDEGDGYWPPGPECPEALDREFVFPAEPSAASASCYTPIATGGLWVNGVAIFNWTDGQSYNNENTWYNLAQKLEVYDGDICDGHAAANEYHHHYLPDCLADQLGDEGGGHSPIYGWMADGYPLYGPWYADGQEAQSCWRTRDYSASSATGCGTEGARTCVLVDNMDPTAGTTSVNSAGPNTSETITSQSGNLFAAESGIYFEDYYFDSDCATQGGAYLDAHNGHEHDGLGYHYHITGSFPYTAGPEFAGALPSSGLSCTDSPYPQRGGP